MSNSKSNIAGLDIRPMALDDAGVISHAFAAIGWNRPVEQYERYFADQTQGRREVFVAHIDSEFAGYVTVEWESKYRPFAERGIPEIVDLNVLPHFRRRGVGTALLDAAEAKIATRADVAGIGVGMGLMAN